MAARKNPSKTKFKRKLTPFLCQEMLYDYAVGRLDSERKQAVEEFLAGDKDSARLLEGIRGGLEYSDRLAATEVKAEVLAHLSEAESAISLGRRYSYWREWPDSVRWSITAVFVSILLAGLVAVIPWKNFPAVRGMLASVLKVKKPDVIEIAQLTRPSEEDQAEVHQDQQEGDTAIEEGSGDEEMDMADEGAPPEGHVQQAPPGVAAKPPAPSPLQLPLPVAVTGSVAASPGQAAKPGATPLAKVAADEETQAPAAKENKPKGFVYRAYMTLGNLDDLGPKITEHITELGGEKAGEVELGWKRGTGRYYHFTVPEEGEEKLLEKLRAYGPVRISKDPHPRIMPEGQVRFILWIEAAEQ